MAGIKSEEEKWADKKKGKAINCRARADRNRKPNGGL